MLAVVRGRAQVGLQVILYAWATVACSLLLIPVAGMGLVYSTVAVATGVWFVYETHRLYNLAIRHEQVSPMRVFHGSIAYLSLLFLAIGDRPAAACSEAGGAGCLRRALRSRGRRLCAANADSARVMIWRTAVARSHSVDRAREVEALPAGPPRSSSCRSAGDHQPGSPTATQP